MQTQEKIITQSDVKKVYGHLAPIYDLVFGAVFAQGRSALRKELASLQPTRILEVGVGTGLMLDKYPINSKVNGIDIAKEMLEIAKHRAATLPHMNIQLDVMDAEKLDFENNSFDCVVMPYVLSVTPNPDALVAEVRRVCEKDGTIMIVNHFSGNGPWYLLEKLVKNIAEIIGFRSEFDYESHILKHDWHVKKVTKVNLFGLSKLIVIRNK